MSVRLAGSVVPRRELLQLVGLVTRFSESSVPARDTGLGVVGSPSTAPPFETWVDIDEEGAYLLGKVGNGTARAPWLLR